MKWKLIAILFASVLLACTPLATPTIAPPTITPLPSTTFTPTRLATLATLGMRERISLRDLPGIGRAPRALVALGDKFYTANTSTDNLAVIQGERVVKFIPVPQPIALTTDSQQRLYIASADKTIHLLVNDQVTRTQNLAEEPSALLFQDNRLFVGAAIKPQIFMLDPATLQTTRVITLANIYGILNLAGDPARQRIYALAYEKLLVLDSNTGQVLATYATPASYYTLLVSPNGDTLYVTSYDATTNTQYLVALDPHSGTTRGRVQVGGDPRSALFSRDGARVYVANSFSNTISVIDARTMTTLATVAVGMQPHALAFDSTARHLYVANYGSDNVHVIDLQTHQVVITIPLAMNVTALVANESAQRVYVANASTDSVFVVESGRVSKEIVVGRHPIDLVHDATNARLIVANRANGTLTLVDEATWSARVTPPITRTLSAIALDATRARLFADGVILDAKTLTPQGHLALRGVTLGSLTTPQLIHLNPNLDRLYAIAWNGVPGSNSRNVTYSIDSNTLQQRTTLAYAGNHNHLAIDPQTNRVFIAGTHPLAFTSELNVFDANDQKVFGLMLPARPMGMLLNPATHHLFLSLSPMRAPIATTTPTPTTEMVVVLDINSFGEVARWQMNAPGKMTRLGDTIYVANRDDGSLTVIQDARAPIPPSPTPTFTPTPYPTLTPTRAVATPRVTNTPIVCTIPRLLPPRWTNEMATRLGCPIEPERSGNYARQKFERGTLFWREEDRRILVLFDDHTWLQFNDTWTSALPEDTCPQVSVKPPLVKPKRGFGKLWCEQTAVRTKLSAALEDEVGLYSALTQRTERGFVFTGRGRTEFYVLYNDGTWE
ncbi:MAG: YncE family protein [Anaerolineae bacterium]|nr:YncE family protein [Anaerolineae bacterium]